MTALVIATGCSTTEDSNVAATDAPSVSASGAPDSTTTSVAAPSAGPSASRSAGPSASSSSRSSAAQKGEVTAKGVDGTDVTLTGAIAAKYRSATDSQRKGLGPVLMGDHNAGTRDSGLIYQQFKGGVITAKNADATAFITWGKIRDAWNIERDSEGRPDQAGRNGSAGPLGAVTSDETAHGKLKQTTFEHGKITFNTQTGAVEVTVNGKVVPAGL